MLQKTVLSVVLILSLSGGVLAPATMAADTAKPNIVLVLMDNFGYGEVGVYGGGVLRGAPTPNIDSIAAAGFQLTNFNVEAECTTSRSSLMTGRYAARTRLQPGGEARGIWYGITEWEVTLAEMLTDAGYATATYGKWHLGAVEGRYPTDQGFDEWYGIPYSSDQSFWPDSDSVPSDVKLDVTYVTSATRDTEPEAVAIYDRAMRRAIDRERPRHHRQLRWRVWYCRRR